MQPILVYTEQRELNLQSRCQTDKEIMVKYGEVKKRIKRMRAKPKGTQKIIIGRKILEIKRKIGIGQMAID